MSQKLNLELEPADTERLANLCGQFDEHLKQMESRLQVDIFCRGNLFVIQGESRQARATRRLLIDMYKLSETELLTPEIINLHLQDSGIAEIGGVDDVEAHPDDVTIITKRGAIRGRGPNQKRYLRHIDKHAVNFGIGPAGTGKTYLAVASAVAALQTDRVQRIVLVRPAVEAGERLGFLPGDLAQKVDPYLRPLYDALYEMLGFDHVTRLIDRNVIEVAPLAFMRGRTLNDAFIILDEAQNTTTEQMKMFLTRTGFGSTAVITGDVTQIDLPKNQLSGLKHAVKILKGVEGISFSFFSAQDVVRHPMVQRIVMAYDAAGTDGSSDAG
ncbi:MAG: PhoH family protein [Xanthomonadales bacterium]|nr:PhoH family protein [Gammaproteobacteria bacterium]MBT8072656.1 PhoH family protein [Gammaproteobacteria bacterium]MBT8076134.1 PhoH family protein [Gammaproteobacteria bacterium]NNK03497.1 PhoH family protein [Xanthomonadales bacterium]NNK99627.1 PhoH family protein [Xanthomonadales bacterium]